MPGNVDPIFSRVGDIQWTTITAAAVNTAVDGTGTVFTAFTADTANGGFVQALRIKCAAINTQTVLRVFVNNGSANTTAANNSWIDEITLAASTASNTTSGLLYELPIGRALPPGYKINVAIATALTAPVYVTAIGGKY